MWYQCYPWVVIKFNVQGIQNNICIKNLLTAACLFEAEYVVQCNVSCFLVSSTVTATKEMLYEYMNMNMNSTAALYCYQNINIFYFVKTFIRTH